MVIIPWNGKDYHEKSDIIKSDYFNETIAFNRGVFSTGDLPPWIVPLDNSIVGDLLSSNTLANVRNRCISKIVGDAQLVDNYFEAIYERNQAMALAASAAKKLLDFLINFKKPKYWKGVVKRQPKDLPEAWLTYNFGVKPLIGTIDSAMKLLGKPYPTVILKGGAGAPIKLSRVDEGEEINDTHFATGSYFQQMRAYVSPNGNPNAALANIVGLSTPFSTAMSVLPWGWAVDYFVNCSQLLNNIEDEFPGIYFNGVWQSIMCKVDFGSVRLDKITNETTVNYGEAHCFYREPTALRYALEFSFPPLGGNQFANLASAIALTMKGKRNVSIHFETN